MPCPERGIAPNNIAANAERSETVHQHHKALQSTDNEQNNQIWLLQAEVAALKMANQQLNDKCLKLELDKQDAEKQARIFYKQLEKSTQVLNKLKKEV
ncbi:MAG: hypothetical protein ACXV8I_09140 [Methylobacter sp.]